MTCKHLFKAVALALSLAVGAAPALAKNFTELKACLLYTSDAADEL